MSERVDQKLESVVLARFHYRHEAEFAAGFLDDAGIPYRLQVDDAAMGMTIATPATLWVRGMDLRDAREVLDLPDVIGALTPPDRGRSRPSPDLGDGGRIGSVSSPDAAVGAAGSQSVDPARLPDVSSSNRLAQARGGHLSDFERLLAFVLLVGDLGAAGLAQAAPYGPIWTGLLVAVAGPLAAAAFTGRTLGPFRRLLKAISGSAP